MSRLNGIELNLHSIGLIDYLQRNDIDPQDAMVIIAMTASRMATSAPTHEDRMIVLNEILRLAVTFTKETSAHIEAQNIINNTRATT